MRGLGIAGAVFVALLIPCGDAAAGPKPIRPIPSLVAPAPAAVSQRARVRKLLPAGIVTRAESEARALLAKNLEGMTVAAVTDAARASAGKVLSVKATDIDAIVFIILMEAGRAAEEDLRALMESTKRLNAEREKVRAALKNLELKGPTIVKAAPPAYLKKIGTSKTPNLQLPYATLPEVSVAVCEAKVDGQCLDELRQKSDALDELGETQSLRMQMVMDRMAKADQAASNLLKKTSETTDSILSNFK